MDEMKKENNELDEDELEAVAGGADCGCAVFGGGTANQQGESTCACVGGGGGEMTEGGMRCVCVGGGYGNDAETMGRLK